MSADRGWELTGRPGHYIVPAHDLRVGDQLFGSCDGVEGFAVGPESSDGVAHTIEHVGTPTAERLREGYRNVHVRWSPECKLGRKQVSFHCDEPVYIVRAIEPALHSAGYGAGYAAFLHDAIWDSNASEDWRAGFEAAKRHSELRLK